MGRPKKVVDAVVAPAVEAATAAVVEAVQTEVAAEVAAPKTKKRKRVRTCIAPRCQQPSKGPRFRFCCEKHREAPLETVKKWQEAAKA
jgi:hypothetical protein